MIGWIILIALVLIIIFLIGMYNKPGTPQGSPATNRLGRHRRANSSAATDLIPNLVENRKRLRRA